MHPSNPGKDTEYTPSPNPQVSKRDDENNQSKHSGGITLEVESVHSLYVTTFQGKVAITTGTATVIHIQNLEGILESPISDEEKREMIDSYLAAMAAVQTTAAERDLFTTIKSNLRPEEKVEAIKAALNRNILIERLQPTQPGFTSSPAPSDVKKKMSPSLRKIDMAENREDELVVNQDMDLKAQFRDVAGNVVIIQGANPVSHQKKSSLDISVFKQALQKAYADYGFINSPLFDEKQNQRLTLEASYIQLTLIKERAKDEEKLKQAKEAPRAYSYHVDHAFLDVDQSLLSC